MVACAGADHARRTTAMIIAAARDVDLSTQVLGILACIAERPGQPMKDVMARLGISSASFATRGCDKLVEAGLVQRQRGSPNRRLVELTLTQAGEDVLRRIGDAESPSA
jgi:DNA-binding MarR family transcriptional regulator